jgi:hypothetical protein
MTITTMMARSWDEDNVDDEATIAPDDDNGKMTTMSMMKPQSFLTTMARCWDDNNVDDVANNGHGDIDDITGVAGISNNNNHINHVNR